MIQKSFDEVYQIVEESSHETAFNRGEAQELWNLCQKLDGESVVLEIGVQYGRSTSVIAEAQKERKFHFIAVDNFCEPTGEKQHEHIRSQMKKHGWDFVLMNVSSKEFFESLDYTLDFDLVHIDGDHSYRGVMEDCQFWMPYVVKGGHAVFDDYEHESLPEVTQAIRDYMLVHPFKFVGKYGDKLGVFKRK